MLFITRATSVALALAGPLLAGCAGEGNSNIITTGAIGNQPRPAALAPKVDPVCLTLATQIDELRREGIADKIEKAAVKKYKMTHGDLANADRLIKANAEFQMRCSTVTPQSITAQSSSTPAATPR